MDLLNIPPHDRLSDMVSQPNLSPKKTKADYSGYNPIYLNRFQRRCYNYMVRRSGIKAGRGTGKTTLMGIQLVRCAQTIPRGTGLFGGASIKSLLCKVQPSLISSIEQVYGFQEGREFVRCQPNPKWGWATPLNKPRSYENALTFYTGHITYFTSVMSKASGSGMNLTDIQIDEARYVDYAKMVEECIPAVRGGNYENPGWTEANPWYKSQLWMSDAAVTPKQMIWENEFRKLCTPDLNEKLAVMFAELQYAPELSLLPKFVDRMNRLKYKCANMFEFNTLYNVEIIGEDTIREYKLQMPPLLFNVQIMGMPLDASVDSDAYYFCFNQDIHLYEKNESDEMNIILGKTNKVHAKKSGIGLPRVEWEAPDLTETSQHAEDDTYDVDIDTKYPLCLSWDLNANFNTVVISQRIPHKDRIEVRIINCLYTKYKEKLRALLGKFLGYYANHRLKNNHCIIILDDTMKQGASYALEDVNTRYISVIQSVLRNAGWDLEIEDMGRPMLHEEKFQLINDIFAGQTKFDIRINRELDFLILALTKARVIQTQRGPQKDKSKEKLHSESDTSMGQSLETRTDVTDAFDQSILAAVKHEFGTQPKGTSGVFFSLPTEI